MNCATCGVELTDEEVYTIYDENVRVLGRYCRTCGTAEEKRIATENGMRVAYLRNPIARLIELELNIRDIIEELKAHGK